MKTPLKTILMKFLDRFQELEVQDDLYENEFQNLKHLTNTLKGKPEYSYSFGMKDVNRPKNRYKDIVPYDFCRVVLPELSTLPGADYINASYVKTKCERYWAEETNKTKQFGEISIEFISELQMCPDFMVRSLLITQGAANIKPRKVWQFHYATWPDHSVPDTVKPILQMVRMMRRCQAAETAPILVHCSAGCGRTGTICAIDFVGALLRRGKLTENFCLHDIISEMRKQRIAMVQTKEQYVLVYKAVAAMFEQQLQIIDSHPYENLDEDGLPLTLKGQDDPLQHLYSEIPAYQEETKSPESKPEDITTISYGAENGLHLNNGLNGYKHQNNAREEENNNRISKPSIDSMDFSLGSIPIENSPVIPLATTDESKLSINDTSFDKSEIDVGDTGSSNIPFEVIKNKHLNIGDKGLKSGISSESIPFIDDEDTKSEICIRPRCGRGYIQRPSYDCIPKFITPFDPFVETAFDNSYKSVSQIFADTSLTTPSSKTESMISTHTLPFDVSNFGMDNGMFGKWNDENVQSESAVEVAKPPSLSDDVSSIEGPLSKNIGNLLISTKTSTANIDRENFKTIDAKPPEKPLPRRSSLTRFGIKSLFEKSRTKPDGKSTLFRYHSHHVSRAGSAPPSLNSMSTTNENEKESLFNLVSRKFRSSSVKSEHELRKEAGTTLQFSSLKKSAVNSFTQMKQNISNFSRTLTLNKYSHRNPPSQITPLDLGKPTATKNGEKSEGAIKNSHWYDSSPPKIEKQKLSPIKNQTDEAMESIQQKFVVNVLSSGHNKIVIGKPNTADKPTSPKSKMFGTEKKMPRLLSFGSSTGPKNNKKDTSTLWYYNERGETVNMENKSLEDCKPSFDTQTVKQNAEKSISQSPLTPTALNSPSAKEIKKSIFYTESQDDSTKPFLPLKKKDTNFYVDCVPEETNVPDTKRTENSNSPKKLENSNSPKSFWPSNSIAGPPENNVSKKNGNIVSPTADNSNTNVMVSESNINNSTCQKAESLIGESSPAIEKSDKLETFVPPELPKKTVIGRNRGFMFEAFKELSAINKPADASDVSVKIPSLEQSSVPEKEKVVIISEPANNKSKDGLYTNVNLVAQKNIEQIENTLRNHPRGAIIDLTSRNSYSLEEELATAIKKLPDPLQKHRAKFSLSQLANLKRAGYEVIWPTSEESGHFALTSDLKYSRKENSMTSGFADFEKEKESLRSKPPRKLPEKLKSGICYSPPLKRSPLANFPVLKSQSCARLDWLDKDDTAVENKNENSKPDRSETLVNDAVVELSTLLDELTTRTLKDDLELKQDSCSSVPSTEYISESKSDSTNEDIQLQELKSTLVDVSLDASTNSVFSPEIVPPSITAPSRTKTAHEKTAHGKAAHEKTAHEKTSHEKTSHEKTSHEKTSSGTTTSSEMLASAGKFVNAYEAIFIPQVPPPRQKKDDDIVFHFPPPPTVPPPPQKYIEVESFDIVCKDGMLHVKPLVDSSNIDEGVIGGSKEDLQTQTFNSTTETQYPPPIPLPRRKQINLQSSGNLRKSASYTTLVPELPLNNQIGNIAGERCQTLPRLLIDESAYVFESTLSQSVSDVHSLENRALNFQQIPPVKKSANYETIFPQVKLPPTSQSAIITQTNNIPRMIKNDATNNSKSSSSSIDDLKDDVRSSIMMMKREIQQKAERVHISSDGSVKREKVYIRPSVSLESNTREPSDPIYGRIDRLQQQHRQRLVSADECILKISHSSINPSLDLQKQKKRSVIPSRKLQHAPPPPVTTSKPQTEESVNMKIDFDPYSEKVARQHATKKERTSHAIKRSSSTKDFPRSSGQTRMQEIPTYSVIQKQKLHAVLENISDPQAFVKSSVLTSSNQPKTERHLKNASSGYPLQYSQSDASVHKKLREKFVSKGHFPVNISNDASANPTVDVSNSNHNYEKLFLSSNANDQKSLETVINEKVSAPVAPPRARRRSTIEIDFLKAKNLAGMPHLSSVSQVKKIGSAAISESLPAVPVKTKEAFELPKEFLHSDTKFSEQSASRSKAFSDPSGQKP